MKPDTSEDYALGTFEDEMVVIVSVVEMRCKVIVKLHVPSTANYLLSSTYVQS